MVARGLATILLGLMLGVTAPAFAQQHGGDDQTVPPPASAAIAPDGLRAAWVTDKGHSIVSATRAARDADWSAPNRLLTTRGAVHGIVFSPDGQSLAYENSRTWKDDGSVDDGWEFIGVYDIATRQISYVDPSFDRDSEPVWLDDGRAISFIRKVPGLADQHLTRPVTAQTVGLDTAAAAAEREIHPGVRPGRAFCLSAGAVGRWHGAGLCQPRRQKPERLLPAAGQEGGSPCQLSRRRRAGHGRCRGVQDRRGHRLCAWRTHQPARRCAQSHWRRRYAPPAGLADGNER